MSRHHILQRLVKEGLLLELPSPFLGYETARTMYVTPDIFRAVSKPFPSDPELAERLYEFRQWLDGFTEGGLLTVAEDPDNKPPDVMMARVKPVKWEFFSIRVTLPETTPGIRSLGGFFEKDEFIALTWDLRENIDHFFDDEVVIVEAAWRNLFGSETPHKGDHLNEYLSNADSV